MWRVTILKSDIVSLFYLSFLRALYHQAKMVQRDFNLLVHKIAGDGDFLEKTLKKTVEGTIIFINKKKKENCSSSLTHI